MQKATEYIRNELRTVYTDSEIQYISYLLFEKLTGLSRTQLLISKNTTFSMEQRKEMESFVEKAKKGVPIQYILEKTEFYGLLFEVNEAVLIPRPETEELVEWIKEENSSVSSMLDIGTGSGCIAIALKKEYPVSDVSGWDISNEALQLAERNAESNGLDVHFEQVDILNVSHGINKKWDIIVSNPPYIPEKEKNNMHANVLDYEPHLALFVPDDDALLYYRAIARFAAAHLNPDGKLYFEIHYDAGKSVVDLLSGQSFAEIKLKQDLSGNNRMVRAVKA